MSPSLLFSVSSKSPVVDYLFPLCLFFLSPSCFLFSCLLHSFLLSPFCPFLRLLICVSFVIPSSVSSRSPFVFFLSPFCLLPVSFCFLFVSFSCFLPKISLLLFPPCLSRTIMSPFLICLRLLFVSFVSPSCPFLSIVVSSLPPLFVSSLSPSYLLSLSFLSSLCLLYILFMFFFCLFPVSFSSLFCLFPVS